MEEVVIVIADLYLTSAAEAASIRGVVLPGLGRIARYGAGHAIHNGWRAWLARWIGNPELAAESPATVAAAASRIKRSDAVGRMAWLATPVHMVAGLSSVHLDARGLLRVEPEVRRMLATEFNRVFADSGCRLEALGSSGFLLTTPQISAPPTVDPARVLGASVTEALPAASAAPELRRLGAEVEMWLHDHQANADRVKRGRLPITALWLWGGGVAREGVGAQWDEELLSTQNADTIPASALRGAATLAATAVPSPGVAFGGDPYLHGLWRSNGASARAMPNGFNEVLGHSGRRAVFVVDLLEALDAHREWTIRDALVDADRRWIAAALDSLHRREVARVTVVANDHKLTLGPRDRMKLWRMPRPALSALQ